MFDLLLKFGPQGLNALSDEERDFYQMLFSEEGRQPNPFFEGYSHMDFFMMLQHSFGPFSIVQIKKTEDEVYMKSPMFFLVRKLCDIIEREGYIKLTKEGLLPLDVMTELNVQDRLNLNPPAGTCMDQEGLVGKLLRLLLFECNIVRMQNKRMVFRKASLKVRSDNHELFTLLFRTFCTYMNWKQIDGLPAYMRGIMGCSFQFILLKNYGHISKNCSFYSESFLKLGDFGLEEQDYLWYTFELCLQAWGFVVIEKKEHSQDYFVRRSALLDEIIHINPFKEFVIEPIMSVSK